MLNRIMILGIHCFLVLSDALILKVRYLKDFGNGHHNVLFSSGMRRFSCSEASMC